jgi:tetratricopeptide (TPR) repeat protein
VSIAELIAGVGDGWNRGDVLQHLGNQINSRFFRDWLRRYGRELRGLSDADYRLARRLVQLSQLGCGEFGEIAGDIGRDLLLKPMGEDVEETKTLPPETSSPSDRAISIDNGDSDEVEVWFNRGYQQYISGDFLGAIASWDKAIQIQPDFHVAWDIRGIALYNLGRLEEALVSCDRAIQIKPDFHVAWNSRGIALSNLGRLEEAVVSCDRAIQIQPDFHVAWHNRGNALSNLGRLEEAVASYDRAIQIKPNDHYAWDSRGNALSNLGRLEEAVASYDRAIQIKPNDHYAWNNRSNALSNLGRLEEAVASCDRAIQIKPDYHEAWNSRGVALSNLGRLEEEVASYDRAIQIKPDYHQAWNSRGVALKNLGRLEEAVVSYDRAIQIQPDNYYAWLNRGVAAGESRHYNPESAILLQLQFPTLPLILPDHTLTQRGYEGKLLSYETGLKHCLQDTHPEGWGLLHRQIGKAHYFQGKEKPNYREYWHKAVAEYKLSLITLTPEAYSEFHLQVLQDLLRVLWGLGKETEAKEWRRKGLDVFGKLLNRPMSAPWKQRRGIKTFTLPGFWMGKREISAALVMRICGN